MTSQSDEEANIMFLFRMLLYSPEFAQGWNAFLGPVRTQLEVPWKLREIAMCIVAVCNGAEYEFVHHLPEFIKAGGSKEQGDALRGAADVIPPGVFSRVEELVIKVTVQSTRNVKVDRELMAELVKEIGEKQTVEIIGTIGAYNCVSRFLVALEVTPEGKSH
jgi:alkylhydroperoxidase family enzyme